MRTPLVIALALGLSACAGMNDSPRHADASPEVRSAQYRLHALGFYNGPPDGLWGPETASAVERFQRDRGLYVTARLDANTEMALRDMRPATLTSENDVRVVQDHLAQAGFYHGPIDGAWGPDTQVAMERFQRAHGLEVGRLTPRTLTAMNLDPDAFRNVSVAGQSTSSGGFAPPAREAAYPLQPSVVKAVQDRLHDLGFYKDRTDGVWGPSTRAALQDFQRSRGMEATGDLTPATASVLGFDPNNLEGAVARR